MLLFVNACMREGSRTDRLARMWLQRNAVGKEVVELDVAALDARPLNVERLAAYSRSVKEQAFRDEMFSCAHQFAQADEVLIAAPFWNYSLPAKLHDYLELVCSQGVTFDIDADGNYVGLVRARRITYVCTAGGPEVAPEDDHAFGYVRTLARRFWFVPEVECVAAWGLDAPCADVDALLAEAVRPV